MPVFLLGGDGKGGSEPPGVGENPFMEIEGVPFGNALVGKEDCSDEPNEGSGASLPRPDRTLPEEFHRVS